MNIQKGKHVTVSYKLTGYEMPDSPEETPEVEDIEETTPDRPFSFIFGVGQLIAGFERYLEGLQEGDAFDFTLAPAEAYGSYREEDVHEITLPKEDLRKGGFPMEFLSVGADLPLQNEAGEIMQSVITRIEKDTVVCKLDLNHPMAGMTLHFVGKVLTVRDATEDDKREYMRQMTGSCSGSCGGCNGESCGSCSGHCHEEGGSCGQHEGGHCKHHQ